MMTELVRRPRLFSVKGEWMVVYQEGRIRDRTVEECRLNLAANKFANELNSRRKKNHGSLAATR